MTIKQTAKASNTKIQTNWIPTGTNKKRQAEKPVFKKYFV